MRPRFRDPNQDDPQEQEVVDQPARLPESRRVSKSFPQGSRCRRTDGTRFRLACCFASVRRCRPARSERSPGVIFFHAPPLPRVACPAFIRLRLTVYRRASAERASEPGGSIPPCTLHGKELHVNVTFFWSRSLGPPW